MLDYKNYTRKLTSSEIIKSFSKENTEFWEQEKKTRSLKLFREAAKYVPAYKDFLKKNRVKVENIKTYKDFQQVPIISKKNYLKQYELEDLCWGGTLKHPMVFTSTSGSTGKPFYFPRWEHLDWEYSVLVEDFLQHSSHASKGPILVIIGFGMGVWIGGLITYKAFEIAAQRLNLPVSIITPGINKLEIFKALKNIAPHYKETILVGYPPFLKDVIDESKNEKINLKNLNVRLFSAAESYTEKFRSYIADNAGVKNTCLDITNIYGTADIGAMAWETPTSILIRQLAVKNQKLFENIFSQVSKTPTLAQYNPFFISFESIKGEIVLTGNNAIPLIRYAVGDQGGITTFDEIKQKFDGIGIVLKSEAQRNHIKSLYKLPFVYVYERSDFSVSLYGLNIYPEPVREALMAKPICKYLTGKFTMEVNFNNKQNQFLLINLELKNNGFVSNIIKKEASDSIIENLEKKNSEYRELHKFLGKRALPKLAFLPVGDSRYFRPGVKQKWVKK